MPFGSSFSPEGFECRRPRLGTGTSEVAERGFSKTRCQEGHQPTGDELIDQLNLHGDSVKRNMYQEEGGLTCDGDKQYVSAAVYVE